MRSVRERKTSVGATEKPVVAHVFSGVFMGNGHVGLSQIVKAARGVHATPDNVYVFLNSRGTKAKVLSGDFSVVGYIFGKFNREDYSELVDKVSQRLGGSGFIW